MDRPAAPIFPILDKSHLFVPLPTDPQNQSSRYLECAATGHLYCMSTGSLLLKKASNTAPSAIFSFLSQRKDSFLLPSNPTPYRIKPFSENTKNIDQQPTTESNTSPKVKHVNQPIQNNSTLITQSNIVPNVKNAHQHMQDNLASNILNTKSYKTLEVNHGDQPFQGDSTSVTLTSISKGKNNQTPNVNNTDKPVQGNCSSSNLKTTSKVKKYNINLNVKKGDQFMPGDSTTPNTLRNKASKSKTDRSIQANSPGQSTIKSTVFFHSNSDPTTKKEIKKRVKKTKDTSIPLMENNCAISKKKSASSRQNKSDFPQPKPTTSVTNNPSTFENPAAITQATKKHEAIVHPDYNLSPKSKGRSYTFYKFYLNHMIKLIQPIQINFEDLLFPENVPLLLDRTNVSRKHAEENTEIIRVCSLSNPMYKCSLKNTKKQKPPSLYLSSQDHIMIWLENNFKKKTVNKKNFGAVSQDFKTIWAVLKPFNRRPRPQQGRKKSLVSSHCKNCIMDSSVHEIIHSRFAKNINEHMPESQLRALLNSGDRKLRTRSDWIKRMEEEAIRKYKKLNLEKHNRRLEVQGYDVLHHEEKFWLACSSRSVINGKDEMSWPLLVKCLHKYPDSTLRQASTHRSFCLLWNGKSYTLRMDHAYYTQIQCRMAITNSSYAELLVHTRKETTILPVYFDSDFWKRTEETLETFFTGNILPYLKKNEIELNPISAPLNSENLIEE